MKTKKLTTRSSWQEWRDALADLGRKHDAVRTHGALSADAEWNGAETYLSSDWWHLFGARADVRPAAVMSYSTPIAFRIDGVWVMPIASHSVTTTRHQNRIAVATDAAWVKSAREVADLLPLVAPMVAAGVPSDEAFELARFAVAEGLAA
jgi:hypothetical protein